MRAHSLRPHSMQGHLVLYRSVLHNPDNTLPFWFLEVVASYVSMTNKCDYSLTHHFANARRLMNDPERSALVWDALQSRETGTGLLPLAPFVVLGQRAGRPHRVGLQSRR
jgi:alkylhydroperoxidase family enzyme